MVLGFGYGTGNCLMVLGCRVVQWFVMWSVWYVRALGWGQWWLWLDRGKIENV